MRKLLPAMASVAFICSASAASATNNDSCEREMVRAAAKHDIPLGVLYAVGLAETGKKGSLQPYAMNIEGRAVFASSAGDAMQKFDEARRSGARLIDLGCMQINHYYHGDRFRSVANMLSPRENVEYAAQFLKQLKAREGSWTVAVARYHAGPNNDPAQKTYVCRVISNMVASGFGEWTVRARTFCQ